MTRRRGAVCATAVVLALAGVASTAGPMALTATAATASSSSIVGLRLGDRGPGVTTIQQRLTSRGYVLPVDGVFGPRTDRVLRSFQTSSGLNPTGVVTENTARFLGLAAGVPSAPTATSIPTSSTSSPTTASPAATAIVGLKLGDHGAAVRQVQTALLGQGFVLSDGADGVFGRSTEHAVALVQRFNQLPQTGVVSSATARALGLGTAPSTSTSTTTTTTTPTDASPYVGLTAGATGARVRDLQRALLANGITVRGGADGLFGPATATAVGQFQRAHGLTSTGRVNAATARALGLTGGPAPATPAAPARVTLSVAPVGGVCWYTDTWRAARSAGRVHIGTDIGAAEGTPVRAVSTGRISYVYLDRPGSLSGNALKVRTANGTYFFYAHLSAFARGVGVGTPVAAGQVIGYVGHTGNALGPHLHFEVHPGGGAAVNPYPILKAGVGGC